MMSPGVNNVDKGTTEISEPKWNQSVKTEIVPEEADFETAISSAGYGKYNVLLHALTLPVVSSLIFTTSSAPYIVPPASCEYDLSNEDKGLLNGAPFAGMISAAYMWGALSDNLGRKTPMVFGFFADVCMNFAASLCPPGSWWMLFFKFMSGFMICGPFSIFVAYLSEVFNNKHRSLAIMSIGVHSCLGSIILPAIAMIVLPLRFRWFLFDGLEFTSWRLFMLITCTPSLVGAVSSIFIIESPKFLYDKRQEGPTLKSIKKIYSVNTGQPEDKYPIKRLRFPEIQLPTSTSEDPSKSFRVVSIVFHQLIELLKPPMLFNSLFAFIFQFGSLTSTNVMRVLLPLLFNEAAASKLSPVTNSSKSLCDILQNGQSKQNTSIDCYTASVNTEVHTNMIWVYGVSLITLVLVMMFARGLSKKSIMIFGTSVGAVCSALVPLVPIEYLVVVSATYISVLNVFFHTLTSVVVELFPTNLRATGMSMSLMCGRMGLLFGNIFITPLVFVRCSYVFYGFCILLATVSMASILAPFGRKPNISENPHPKAKPTETSRP